MQKLRILLLSLSSTLLFSCQLAKNTAPSADERPLNVLFIAVDDLRPELGVYGQSHIHSPNMDRLAGEGILFEQAYCNVPVCGASRASLLSGLRPNKDRFLNFNVRVTEDAPGIVTLPEYFKNHGYQTVSLGKVFHHLDDAPKAWSEPAWRPPYPVDLPAYVRWCDYQSEENLHILAELNPPGQPPAKTRGLPYESYDAPDTTYFDGKLAQEAIRRLQRLSGQEKPFFMAVGFVKPHLPFNAPKKYWDLYPEEDIELAANPFPPKNVPDQAMHHFGELRQYYGIPAEGAITDEEMVRKMRHGYYACISYVDAQIGRLLDELKQLGMEDNTIVLLWGDHGFQLGEHGLWCKHCTFHNALHVPMLLKVPGKRSNLRLAQLTEYVDIYPSLCELAGLPIPQHADGDSFLPLINGSDSEWKEAVFPRWKTADVIQTSQYTYTEWYDKAGAVASRMLYDHQTDPEENHNVAEEPAYTEVVKKLSSQLQVHVAASSEVAH